MRKLFSLVLALALIMTLASVSFAAYPSYPNTVWGGGFGDLNQPPSEIIRVRYSGEGLSHPTLASGAAVLWDTNSHDGVSVIACSTDLDQRFAGIAVTDLLTQDSGKSADIKDDRYGYICVRGWALASIDTAITVSATMARLTPSANRGLISNSITTSSDVATLLQTSTAGALYPVWVTR